LRGFRKIQQEVLKALKMGVHPKEYRSVAAAYKDAVSGERMVLGMEGTGQSGWPDEMVVRWVDEEDEAGENAEDAS
jgi:hypothetical protein